MNKESLLMQSLYTNEIQSLVLCKLPSFLTQLPYPASLPSFLNAGYRYFIRSTQKPRGYTFLIPINRASE